MDVLPRPDRPLKKPAFMMLLLLYAPAHSHKERALSLRADLQEAASQNKGETSTEKRKMEMEGSLLTEEEASEERWLCRDRNLLV